MKFSLITAAGVLSAISQASAVTIVTPWAQTVWTSGGHGLITWNTTAADANLKCDIYLLNGQFNNSNIVAQITDPATPVACSTGSYDMYPLNDFVSGQYWIRIGQASTSTWTYSAAFQFNGKGSANPISLASTANGAAAATGTAAKPAITAAAATKAVASGSSSGSAPKATTTTSGASIMSVSNAAIALGAVAAIAFNL